MSLMEGLGRDGHVREGAGWVCVVTGFEPAIVQSRCCVLGRLYVESEGSFLLRFDPPPEVL